MITTVVSALVDLVAIALFILGLHYLNSPAHARKGNRMAMVGMAIALLAAAWQTAGSAWLWIVLGIAIGGSIGIFAALRVKMTAMPQMVALYNGAGGGAAALIAFVEYYVQTNGMTSLYPVVSVSLVLSAIIGAISFAGSIVAFLKLQEIMTGRPITYPGQQFVNAIVALLVLGLGAWFIIATIQPPNAIHAIHLAIWAFPALLGVALLL